MLEVSTASVAFPVAVASRFQPFRAAMFWLTVSFCVLFIATLLHRHQLLVLFALELSCSVGVDWCVFSFSHVFGPVLADAGGMRLVRLVIVL